MYIQVVIQLKQNPHETGDYQRWKDLYHLKDRFAEESEISNDLDSDILQGKTMTRGK